MMNNDSWQYQLGTYHIMIGAKLVFYQIKYWSSSGSLHFHGANRFHADLPLRHLHDGVSQFKILLLL